ncbi:uncharacterized protein N0V89_003166 [Didymosphaeria variabile]|uniref:Nascent polypeptide-associated complex subunit alpha-like UBA domain-containing protein n=1 Tax=Didymosphaeria variabile TaxID=1932322 RepID=A0A9W9CF32_9PLEO|nr:uncharacterized protein N0V89_003166 [Didymosphaeria variabile]KAJ4358582.1 hypothetical protein N0V89_003166 [Didymosphaeria variabile]
MAEEPQPSNIQEGASDAPAPTGGAEDRKAAAALSSLDAQGDDEAGKKEVDSKAVEKAMKNLSVKDGKGGEAQKKAVKIEASDVNLLMSELELPKPKATELLRANDGNVLKAITSYVTPAFA